MDQEKLIQVSFQIPPSALDSLSRLAEQLRLLTETVHTADHSGGRQVERVESGSFDPERFLALQKAAGLRPEPVRADVSDLADAPVVSAAVSQTENARAVSAAVSQMENAKAVSAAVQKDLPDAKGAGNLLFQDPGHIADAGDAGDPRPAPPERREEPPPPAAPPLPEPSEEISAVRAEAETAVPEAPEARRDAEEQLPNVENVRAEAAAQDLVLAAARGEVSGGIETPLGAGAVVQTQPEMPQSRWSGVTEELVIPGPAPLTAEAVSLAFERDGRRYDNGFPLY